MIQPIVVGTDGSSRADLAVEWAADEAMLRRCPLHIVHAAERWDDDVPLDEAPGMCASLTETGTAVLTQAAERAVKAHPRLPVTTELVFGSPAHALRSLGRRAGEIVVGHRGLGGFTGMLLGSTGLDIAGHVPIPVIVVRGDGCGRRGEVLAGVDLRAETTDVLGYAFECAALRGAWVRVVHAWQAPQSGSVQQTAAVTQERLADVVTPWRAKFPDVGVCEQTPRGHAVEELAGRSARATMLVIGSRGMTGRQGLVLGAVGHGVIHHAGCPVAVVRPPE